MSKGKIVRGKNTPATKIDQMLSSKPAQASEANPRSVSPDQANASSSPGTVDGGGKDGASGTVRQIDSSDFAPFMNEIRGMHRELQDDVKKVGSDVFSIRISIDALKADMATFGTRLGEAEERVSHLEDDNARFENTTADLKQRIAQLESRVQYQENYSRRLNLRIKGIPENSERDGRVVECVTEILRALFPASEEMVAIERAHRVPTVRQEARQDRPYAPRHVLVRFLRYVDREKVRIRARDVGDFRWNGHKVDFFPDFSKDVQDKRSRFTEVRRLCMNKGLRYTLQYPAILWVTLNGKRQRFEDAAAAKKCIERYQEQNDDN